MDLKVSDPQTEELSSRHGTRWLPAPAGELGLPAAVFEALPIAIYMTDAEGRITFSNSCAVALLASGADSGAAVWSGLSRLCWPDGTPMAADQNPMAVALRERHAIRDVEAVLNRADGRRTRLLIHATPLFEGGILIGGANMLVEIGERDRVSYLEQRLAAIVECSEDAIISKDLNGTIATWNRAAEKLFGYTAAEAVGRSVTMLIPDDRQAEEVTILNSIRRGNPVVRYETLRKRKDGSLVPIALTVSPLRDAGGRIIGASKIARDITDQVKVREHQALVLHEMSHRVKNVLAVAGGLVGLSARSAESPRAMAKAVQDRLGAYSRAHELTRTSGASAATRETTLHALVEAIIAPYFDASDEATNVSIQGDDVIIDANATASLALVLHEFTTNAAKYGAFSLSSGRVSIESRMGDGGFEVVWTERGGPTIAGAPVRQGFGSVLAVKTVEGQLGGSLHYDWQSQGVVITMFIPHQA